MSGSTAPQLVSALEDAQRLGFLGARPIPEVIVHARGFVRAVTDHGAVRSALDLGAGGGVPGLVIAHDLPDLQVTLLDRRAKRTDFLERVVRRLGWADRVSVVCCDVADYTPPEPFDAVVARGFGPPEFTLSAAVDLVRPDGVMVISDPPGVDRWDAALLADLGVRQVASDTPRADAVAHGADTQDRSDIEGLVAVFTTI